MAEITGYETGVERICPWCWQRATALARGPGGVLIPLHVTCAMQMTLIQRKIAAGATRGETLSWKRYFRMQRTSRRFHKARRRMIAQRLDRLLGPGSISGTGGRSSR